METKNCLKCGNEKDLSRFSSYNNGYGVKTRNSCKDCKNEKVRGKRKEISKRYYENNREIILNKSKNYYQNNTENRKKYAKEYYTSNSSKQSLIKRAKTYNITVEEVEEILSRGCEVCGSDGTQTIKGLHIDHCHDTGKVRGCLCHFCNTALGNLKDDLILIQKLGEYLVKNK